MVSAEELLGLKDLEITKEEIGEDEYGHLQKTITCISNKPRPVCPNCGSRNIYANSNRPKMIRDLDSGGYRIVLEIIARNFKCNDCKKYFTEEVDVAKYGAHSTKRFTAEIGRLALNNTFDSIGAEYGLSPSTVSGIFREWVNAEDELHVFNMYCPRVLGIDEAHLCPEGKKGPDDGMRGVFVDVENKTIIDITRDRYKNSVISWLRHIKNNDKLEIVTIDMWEGYRQAIYEVFGDKVKVVVDRFHVIQELILQMQKCRNNVYEHLPEGALKAHKNNLSLLKTNLEDLDDELKRQLNRLFEAVPDVKMCYTLKESFRSIYRCQTRAQAEEAYENWKNAIPKDKDFNPYRQFVKTVDKWKNEIFNFFDCERVTNSTTEAMNSIIKKINREGNGYSFEVLRAKILFGAGRRAYKPVRSHNSKQDNKMSSFFFEKPICSFGVDIDWLSEQVENGEFFRKGFYGKDKD